MIQFSLKCDQDHRFDSWFKSASAFDSLAKAGHISCAVCGSPKVVKAIMAPRVSTSAAKTTDQLAQPAADAKADKGASAQALSKPQTDAEKALSALRTKVEATSEYVGADFVTQARAMNQGDAPERSIYGEARLDQALALAKEGVSLLPLPFRPKRSVQ